MLIFSLSACVYFENSFSKRSTQRFDLLQNIHNLCKFQPPSQKEKLKKKFSKPLTWLHLYHCHKLDPRCFKYQLFHNLIWLIYSCGFLLLFLLFFFQCNRWDSEEIGLLLLLQKAGKRIIAFLHLCETIFFNFYLVSLAFYLFYPSSPLSV